MIAIRYASSFFQKLFARNLLLLNSRKFSELKENLNEKQEPVKKTGFCKKFRIWIENIVKPKKPPPPPTLMEKIGAMPTPFLFAAFLTLSGMLTVPPTFYFTHIQETPLTGRKRFVFFTPDQFDEISSELYSMYISAHKTEILSDLRPEYTFVLKVANRLLSANDTIVELSRKKWNVTIIDQPNQNLIVLPSGHILVFKGMLDLCKTEDQFAAVLAHEMSHAFMGHTAELTKRLGIIDKFKMFMLISLWAVLPHNPEPLIHSFARDLKSFFLYVPYDVQMESEADKVAIRLAARACFDIRETSAFWAKMRILQSTHSKTFIDWLYMHPDTRRRAQSLDNLFTEGIKIRAQMNCPPLPTQDPRHDVDKFREEIVRNELHGKVDTTYPKLAREKNAIDDVDTDYESPQKPVVVDENKRQHNRTPIGRRL